MLQVTLLGHASLVVEGGGAVVLMDPVFADPFHDGVAVSCPSRAVHPEHLPTPDAVIVSHAHTDHFDATGLRFAKGAPVYCPDDPAVRTALRKLGVRELRPLRALEPVTFGGLTVVPTPSLTPNELGALFLVDGASVWNQVDTAIDHDVCIDVLARVDGALDVAFCGYQPLLEYAAQWQSEDHFPRARYDRLLEGALASRARTIVPGSAGIAAPARLEWANPRVFPGSRFDYVAHLRDVAPEIATLLLDPGEAVVVERGAKARKIATRYASVLAHDEERRRFDPVTHGPPPLVDENPRGVAAPKLAALVDELVGALPGALARARHWGVRGPIRTLYDRRAVLELRIALPSGVRTWHLARWSPDIELVEGPHPDPDYVFGYVASALHHYIRHGVYEEPICFASRRRNAPETPAPPLRPFRFTTLDPGRLHGHDLYMVVDDRWAWSLLSLLEDDVD